MNKKSFLYIFLFVFLLVVAYIVLTLSAGRTNFFGRASGSGVLTATNSYVFASPLSARKGDKIRVTVFALDGQGRGVPNKGVLINCKDLTACRTGGVMFTDVQSQTDTLGQAIFDVVAARDGQYEIEAQVAGITIPQTVTITFQ